MKPFINRQTHKVSNRRYNSSTPTINQPQQSSLNKFECARCRCFFFDNENTTYCLNCVHHIKKEYNCNNDTYCYIDRFKSSTRSRSRNSSLSSSSSQRSSSRGRSREKCKPTPRSNSGLNTQVRIDSCMYSSTRHTSPRMRHESIKDPFKRPLSPATRDFYNKKIFTPSKNPDRFKDVFLSGRCLRCFSSNHIGRDCPKITVPCPTICRHCRYLYHPDDLCPYKNDGQRTRSNSRNNSKTRSNSTNSRSASKTQSADRTLQD